MVIECVQFQMFSLALSAHLSEEGMSSPPVPIKKNCSRTPVYRRDFRNHGLPC